MFFLTGEKSEKNETCLYIFLIPAYFHFFHFFHPFFY